MTFPPTQNSGNGGAGSVLRTLVRQNRQQPILGARESERSEAEPRTRNMQKHVPSNPSGTAIPLKRGEKLSTNTELRECRIGIRKPCSTELATAIRGAGDPSANEDEKHPKH
jgi:hypothetical protein